MDISPSEELQSYLDELDEFIDDEIKPLEEEHEQYFDKRREHARTDWESGGEPDEEWVELLQEMRERADEAGFFRFALPEEVGGDDGSNFAMAVIREHLAHKGLGLHNVLQNEASVVGNTVFPQILLRFGTEEQQEMIEDVITGETGVAFGLTEPDHGSDATWMDTTAEKDGDEWIINGAKRWNSGMHAAEYDLVFARTSGEDGDADGITAFLVPTDTDGFDVDYFWWTFNMPTDHAEVSIDDARVPDSAILGEEGQGLHIAQFFVHENRIRQAAASLGAAQFCIDEAVDYANERETWGKPLSTRQAIQFPLAELHTEAEMLRNTIRKTARLLDDEGEMVTESDSSISQLVAMCNYKANDLVCRAADRAMQVHGGVGYSRHKPFEHIYRHHRRYRITEGSEEIQKRRVAGHLFDFI
ncbi:acyl-CoA dehydrogenase family protein [Natronolimnohabitans innermongolicus]|uniref:Acyl-CoA dehydrogenase domain-containing protein n=1 Tax=Natronolimnohabitans innermongolicus JCM 12255 TaxID=1227499 RepID=L9WMD3_9EURY|nr:acyl-CoA dehydrogenase family protein [Natronolimnohabitans innermongolicus]ELY50391.1 acyl-CoA dehydrogenase domain-containing protein [Natronolimnohabitans innermongolicus JCM 12255]